MQDPKPCILIEVPRTHTTVVAMAGYHIRTAILLYKSQRIMPKLIGCLTPFCTVCNLYRILPMLEALQPKQSAWSSGLGRL